jgi:hypothetical protein
MMFALLLAAALAQTADASEPDEIVVRGTRKKCRIEIAHRVVSDADFKARAAEWAAGKPIRVIVPAGTDYKCLARIMFRLNDHGVTRANFVDAPAE